MWTARVKQTSAIRLAVSSVWINQNDCIAESQIASSQLAWIWMKDHWVIGIGALYALTPKPGTETGSGWIQNHNFLHLFPSQRFYMLRKIADELSSQTEDKMN